VQEVDVEAVDTYAELGVGVEPRRRSIEVVTVRPVLAQLLQVRERDALRPVVDRLAFRPASAPQPLPKVIDLSVRELSSKLHQLGQHEPPRSRGGTPPIYREPCGAQC
jgi:hypothetical protein